MTKTITTEYYQSPLTKEQLFAFDNKPEVLYAKRFRTIREDIFFDSIKEHPSTFR